MPRTLVVAVVLATLTAGCVGFVGEDDETDDPLNGTSGPGNASGDDDPEGENESEGNRSGGNETSGNRSGTNETGGPGSGDGQDGDEARWSYDNRTGTAQGTNLLVTSSGSAEETFTVDPETLTVTLNLSAQDGELDVCIQRSGSGSGNQSENGTEEACDQSGTTQDGNASFSFEAPAEGEWTVELQPSGIGMQSVEYELVIAQRVPQDRT